jgi:hypothetical protein
MEERRILNVFRNKKTKKTNERGSKTNELVLDKKKESEKLSSIPVEKRLSVLNDMLKNHEYGNLFEVVDSVQMKVKCKLVKCKKEKHSPLLPK